MFYNLIKQKWNWLLKQLDGDDIHLQSSEQV